LPLLQPLSSPLKVGGPVGEDHNRSDHPRDYIQPAAVRLSSSRADRKEQTAFSAEREVELACR
jgi:hypothetical protein